MVHPDRSDETKPHADGLTGLVDRHAWHLRLKHEILRAARSGDPLAVVMIDLDHFESVNRMIGREAGDRLLREASAAWLGSVRSTDCLGRLGGDEFGVILPDCGFGGARDVLDRLRAATPAGITCSIGIVTWDGAEPAERLMLRADGALYAAKRQGRDRVAG